MSSSHLSTDRRVHAVTPSGNEVVRYDRAGKWYLEGPEVGRSAITIMDAVRLAAQPGADVRKGIPGGSRFDALLKKWLA